MQELEQLRAQLSSECSKGVALAASERDVQNKLRGALYGNQGLKAQRDAATAKLNEQVMFISSFIPGFMRLSFPSIILAFGQSGSPSGSHLLSQPVIWSLKFGTQLVQIAV